MIILAVFTALAVLVNLLFAYRSFEISFRAGAPLDPNRRREDVPFVSIIVPARNEAHQIEACVRSLLAQNYPAFEVIVVDDASTDGTANAVEKIGGVKLVHGAPLPSGWIGKPWAITQGLNVATGSWLLFTDADTVHEPNALMAAISCALDRNVSALSFLNHQDMHTWSERVFLPSIIWTIAFGTGPLADVNDPRKENSIFNGQYLLFERAAYEALGGHEAVKKEIAEDLELSRLVKSDGRFRSALVACGPLVRTRMYRSFSEIWDGFVKNFALGTRGQPIMTAAAITFFAIMSPLAPALLIVLLATGSWLLAAFLGASMLVAMGAMEFGLRRAIDKNWLALGMPLGIATMVAIFATSVVRHMSGGVTWRGREYSPGAG